MIPLSVLFYIMSIISNYGLVGLLTISTIVCLDFECILSEQCNAHLIEGVTLYPTSLMVIHNPKPLTFHQNIKLLKVHVVLNFTDFSDRLSMSNPLCSLQDRCFFHETLNSVCDFQETLDGL